MARLVVRSKPGLNRATREQLLSQTRNPRRRITSIDTSVIEVPRGAADDTIAELRASGAFAFVEEDGHAYVDAVVNDPLFSEQWGALRIKTAESWGMAQGDAVVVAVLDTGVDDTHPDLQGQLLSGWDFVNDDDDPQDDNGHGTNMAGIIAAAADNGLGVAGVAPRATLLPIKCADETGFAFYSDIAAAIVYAVDNGARVINISLSGPGSSSTLQAAVDYALVNDVVVVASAGNDGVTTPTYPAATQGVVAVSATDSNDKRAWFSNYGSWITLAAPGANIYTTYFSPEYTSVYGTSPSAALASAAFALLRSANTSMTVAEAIAAMTANAEDLGSAGWDAEFGYGLVNAYAALVPGSGVSVRDRRKPSVTLITPQKGNLLDGVVDVDVAATDDVGVTGVELEVDGELYASASIGPFLFSWDTVGLAAGMHKVRAFAYDASGRLGRSSLMRVYVTPGSGLLVARAKIRSGTGDGGARIKAIVRLPEGEVFDPAADAVALELRGPGGVVMALAIPAGAMEVRRSAAKYRGSAAPAGGDVRVRLKPNRVGGTYALQLSGRKLDIAAGEQMELVLDVGGNVVSQPLTLRPLRSDLVIP